MPNIRRFKVAPGRHLVLPLGLLPAPGAQHMRMSDEAIVELDFDARATQLHSRFLNNRIKVGDLIEVDEKATGPAPRLNVPPATEPAKPFEVNPPAKEGK